MDTDACAAAGRAPLDVVSAFLSGGATLLQLRAKQLGGAALLALARDTIARARPAGARVIVNDRADLARIAAADGVHVGQEDLPPADVRRVVGPAAIVGVSTHTAEQLERALATPVSYVAIGPVFGTRTKNTGYDAVGLAMVRSAAAAARRRLPLVAIGGITLERARSVIDAGATTVAVISDLLATDDPERRVREYLGTLSV